MQQILIVEDEAGVRMALQDLLVSEGYDVHTCDNGVDAEKMCRARPWDMVILDVMLPRRDGFQVCRNLRADGIATPIIMLTARDSTIDTVMGLRIGADDYITKPFDPQILLARMNSLLRRVESQVRPHPLASTGHRSAGGETTNDDGSGHDDAPALLSFGPYLLNRQAKTLTRDGDEIPLHAQEMRLLEYLATNPGQTLSRGGLLDAVWGYDSEANTRTVDVHVARLRKQLGRGSNRYIQTVRGFGYRFDLPEPSIPG